MMKKLISTLVTIILLQFSYAQMAHAESQPNTSHMVEQLEAIDINTADEQQLKALPGIGRSKAKAIIEYRETYGHFNSIEEITLVKGIGNKMLAKIKDKIRV